MSRIVVTNASRGHRELRWRRVKIRKSLDEICHTMELEIPPGERANVGKHDRIQARAESPLITDPGRRRLVATVMVDEVTAAADASSHSALVLGRSPARDIIDSTWSQTLWPNAHERGTLFDSVVEAGSRFGFGRAGDKSALFGVTAFSGGVAFSGEPDIPDPTEPVGFMAWENESPWAKLIGEAYGQGFMITSSAAGGLFIWRPNSAPRSEGFRIDEGKNARAIEWRENGAEQFREYVVRGTFGKAVEIDRTCNTRRILTIDIARENAPMEHLQRRAKVEMLRRREIRAAITVSGWGLTDSQMRGLGCTRGKEIHWSPNFLIPISAPSMGLPARLLIAEVEHEADAHSMQSAITFANREAFP